MFGSSPDQVIPPIRPLEPRLFSPSPEEQSSYLESQTLMQKESTSAVLQTPKTTLNISSYISFPAYNRPTMFSRLRKIFWPFSTGTATTTTSPTTDTHIKSTHSNTTTAICPIPPPSLPRPDKDQETTTSTRPRRRGNNLPSPTISNLESNDSIERALATQRGQARHCSHTRKVRWADPLVSAISTDPPTRVSHSPGTAKNPHDLKWGNPLITKVSVEGPHLRLGMGDRVIASPSAIPGVIELSSAIPAYYCTHEQTIERVKSISGFVQRGGKGEKNGNGGVWRR